MWIGKLKAGDRAGVQKLWERYFHRLVALARRKLQGARRRVADEEDAALSAFASFCRGAERGMFPKLQDRNSLWPLLVLITTRKAADLVQHEKRQKRGGGRVGGESAVVGLGGSSVAVGGFDQLVGSDPTPASAAQLAEEYDLRLQSLGNDKLRSVALWNMEGYTNAEIAAKLKCKKVTVERKLQTIRGLWNQEIES
jgi:DNA-directed RNA polymerase specialized sigma24 family protein